MRRHLLVFAALVAAVTATAPAVRAQSMLSGVDVMSSTVLQEGQSSFSGLGLRARLHPAQLIPAVEILPSLEYWRNSSTVPPYDIRTTRKDATLAVDARYSFKLSSWNPYIGAGFGIHFLSSRVQAPTLGIVDGQNSLIKGGLSAMVGTSFIMTKRVDNFLELKYHHIPDYRQLKINWGLAVKL